MKKTHIVIVASIFLFVSACVTINVYFPAAEAEDAAAKIVNKIIGDEETSDKPVEQNPQSFNFNPLSFFISSAQAEVNINISSPAIVEITNRLKDRYDSQLKAFLDGGVIGFTNQGFVELIDKKAISLKQRLLVKKLVADENRDRKALYRELAIANGHPDWEQAIQKVFVKTWKDKVHKGWKFQDAEGNWQTK